MNKHIAEQALASADIREVYKRLSGVWRRKNVSPVRKEDELSWNLKMIR